MRTSEIRQRFVGYYEKENYHSLPKASMLDDSIPMSFVMSAGLVQVERSLARTQTRDGDKFVLVQDCFRHFDLDKVGKDDIHLSIFEMPGAFKFGSDGKVDTIQQMWQLAISELGINQDQLWVSFFKGGHILGNEMPEDVIVRQAWLDLGLHPSHVVGLGARDNYWLQGKGFNKDDIIRKSGPNTELFYDQGVERACSLDCLPGCKCGRFIEFSNSLFIRYETNLESGKFEDLQEPFSETVIGIERVAMILQAKESVFDIDCYQPVINQIRFFYSGNKCDATLARIGERVIADHLRALVYLIANNAPPPGKNGRQRLVKKLIRGAITGMVLLEISDPMFLPSVLDALFENIDESFAREKWVEDRFLLYYSMQRQSFMSTIQNGLRELNSQLLSSSPVFPKSQILKLEKEWGLPYLLIMKELKVRDVQVSKEDYDNILTSWKNQLIGIKNVEE